jgi:hypothetical protein
MVEHGLKLYESASPYPGISFEPGIHQKEPVNLNSNVVKRVRTGNPDSHIWNSELGERVCQYQPQILALDGTMPEFDNNLSLEDGLFIWVSLPARPGKINPQGTVFIIGGDLVDFHSPFRKMHHIGKASSELKQRSYGSYGADNQNQFMELGTSLGISVAMGAGFSLSQAKLARREFVKLLLGVGLATGTLINTLAVSTRFLAPVITPLTTSQESKDMFLAICELTRPRIWRRETVDFRTALLAAKTEDTYRYFGLPPTTRSSIVMGNAHTYEAERVIRSPSVRKKIIRDFAKKVVRVYDEVFARYPVMPVPEARKTLFDFMTKVEVVRMNDPGDTGSPYELPRAIMRNTNLVASFQSPQVEEAIADFCQ